MATSRLLRRGLRGEGAAPTRPEKDFSRKAAKIAKKKMLVIVPFLPLRSLRLCETKASAEPDRPLPSRLRAFA